MMYKRFLLLTLLLVSAIYILGCSEYDLSVLDTVLEPSASKSANLSKTEIPTIPYNDRILIAVKDFDCAIDSLNNRISQLTAAITTALIESEAFRVVEREKLSKIMEEQALGMSGAVEEGGEIEVGGLKGLSDGFILTGTITECGTKVSKIKIGEYTGKKVSAIVSIDGRLIDPKTSEVVSAVSGYGQSSKSSFHSKEFDLGSGTLDSAQMDEAIRIAVNDFILNMTKHVYGF